MYFFKLLFSFFNDFCFFHYSWFTVLCQFSTARRGDPVTPTRRREGDRVPFVSRVCGVRAFPSSPSQGGCYCEAASSSATHLQTRVLGPAGSLTPGPGPDIINTNVHHRSLEKILCHCFSRIPSKTFLKWIKAHSKQSIPTIMLHYTVLRKRIRST